jgi:hypothetical protein
VIKSKNGDVYEGDFLGGKKDGEGVLTMANGEQIFGIWKKDRYERSS